jgi:hypothetical protein
MAESYASYLHRIDLAYSLASTFATEGDHAIDFDLIETRMKSQLSKALAVDWSPMLDVVLKVLSTLRNKPGLRSTFAPIIANRVVPLLSEPFVRRQQTGQVIHALESALFTPQSPVERCDFDYRPLPKPSLAGGFFERITSHSKRTE